MLVWVLLLMPLGGLVSFLIGLVFCFSCRLFEASVGLWPLPLTPLGGLALLLVVAFL